MNVSPPLLEVAAPVPSAAAPGADDGAFAQALGAATGRRGVGEQTTEQAPDEVVVAGEDETDLGDGSVAALAAVVVPTEPTAVVEQLPVGRVGLRQAALSRGRAAAAASVALARVGELSGSSTEPDAPAGRTTPAAEVLVGVAERLAARIEGALTGAGAAADADDTPTSESASGVSVDGDALAVTAGAPAVAPGDVVAPEQAVTTAAASAEQLEHQVDRLAVQVDQPTAPTEQQAAATESATVDAGVVPDEVPPTVAAPTATAPAATGPDRAGELTRSVAARVEAAVEALRSAPPPREATIEVEGMRLLVRVRGAVVQVVPDEPLPQSWQRDLGSALADRGLHLGHGDRDHASGGGAGDRERPPGDGAAPTTEPAAQRTSRPAGDDSVLL